MNPSDSIQVVTSTDNTSYMAWQTLLFCFSAITRLGQHPTVIVHNGGQRLRKEYALLKSMGVKVIEAPLFSNHAIGTYLARNEVGSLLVASGLEELSDKSLLFCEPDMLFLGNPDYRAQVSGDYYWYLNYDEPRIRRVTNTFGINGGTDVLNRAFKIGVPYFFPRGTARLLANRWLEVLDTFDELNWIDIMYAFGIAASFENIECDITRFVNDNREPDAHVSGKVIHYCYGDSQWNKRDYKNGKSPFHQADTELPVAPRGTVLGEIVQQIREAKTFYTERTHSFKC